MGDQDQSTQPRPIPYADSRLPIGSAGYRKFEYSSDRAGFWNPAQVIDDGNILALQPGPLHLRFIAVCLIIVACVATMVLASKGGAGHGSMTTMGFRLSVWIFVFIAILIAPGLYSARRRQRKPWIVVDRQNKLIHLPRSNKDIPFARVVRLQFVSIVPLGFSPRTLSYRGQPNSGELQIVFADHAQEQTWCLVAWPSRQVTKRFVAALRQSTGIPVSRVNYLVTGTWQVEAFDEN